MKKTTCRALLGPCDAEILGETPQEMGENSKKHVMEMIEQGDEAHKVAVSKMQKMSRDEYERWYEDFTKRFDSLPNA